MKKLFLLAALCVAAAFSSGSKHDNEINHVEPPVPPETTPLAIAFVEGNSLEFNVGETKTAHYTITGGSDKTVVTAEMQTPDDAYTVETTPTSTSEGTITITAQTPETENSVVVTVSDGDESITTEIAVSTNAVPEKEELAIAFEEGNSLELGVNETKTIHYTITGGSDKTVVKAEMQTADDAYTVKTTPTSATEGTIAITAKMPTDNCVVVTVSDEDRSITAIIDVTLKAFDGKTLVVAIPGTLSQLLADYDKTTITELTVIGNLKDEDIETLNNLPNLAILDMENAYLETLPFGAFQWNKSLTSVKLPLTLKTIRNEAFWGCRNLASITIPNSVTSIGDSAFCNCSSLTSVTIPDSIKSLLPQTFWGCSSLNAFYGKFASSDNRCLIIGSTLIDFAPAGLTSYTIPSSVRNIDCCAFSGCSNLTSITIPNSVTSIGDSAFCQSSSLSAFYGKFASSDNRYLIVDGCLNSFAPAGLTAYTIPDGVTTIGSSAFSDCVSLTSITIGNGVTEIDSFSFSNCISLTSITIPGSMTTIGMSTFSSCNRLTVIYCKAIVPPSVSIHGAFNGVSATLYVPTGCKAAYAAAVGWSKFTIIETEF